MASVPKGLECLFPTMQQNRALSERKGIVNPAVLFLDLNDPSAMRIAVAVEKFTGVPGTAAKTVRDCERAGTDPTAIMGGPRDGFADLLRKLSPLVSEKIRAEPPADQFWVAWVAEGRTRLFLLTIEEQITLPDFN